MYVLFLNLSALDEVLGKLTSNGNIMVECFIYKHINVLPCILIKVLVVKITANVSTERGTHRTT